MIQFFIYVPILTVIVFFQTFLNNYQEKFKIGLKQLNKRKVKHEDWNLFQMCLTLMQTIGIKLNYVFYINFKTEVYNYFSILFVGEFLGSIEEFERNLKSDIIDSYNKLENSDESVFRQYKILLLNLTAQTELKEFVNSIQNGNFKAFKKFLSYVKLLSY